VFESAFEVKMNRARLRAPRPRRYFAGKPATPEEDSDLSEEDQRDDIEQGDIQQEGVDHDDIEKDDIQQDNNINTAKLKFAQVTLHGPEAREEESSEGEYVTDEEFEEETLGSSTQTKDQVMEAAIESAVKPQLAREEVERDTSHGSEESEETDNSEESSNEEPMVISRPIFIRKNQRNQTNEVESIGVGENVESRRKVSTLKLIESTIREEQAARKMKFADNLDLEDIDDTDDLDPLAERAAWKARERARMQRERQALEEAEAELEELERRREMSEQDKLKEDLEQFDQQKKEKAARGKVGYMQKYYHRGAFYQDEELLKRDFSQSVEDDYKDKSLLPKALQVRGGVGLKGRTKYKSLVDEDTTLVKRQKRA
jgi:microfibrillar-associated protein 1